MPNCRKISVGRNKSVEIKFKIDSTQKIARDQEQCIEVCISPLYIFQSSQQKFFGELSLKSQFLFFKASEDYDWNHCVLQHIFSTVGCSLNWFGNFSLTPCTSREQIHKLMLQFKKVKRMAIPKLSQHSGCYPKCSNRHFTLVEVKETDLLWESEWVSEVSISLGSIVFEKRFEYYIYDMVNMSYRPELDFYKSLLSREIFSVILVDIWGCSWDSLACQFLQNS